MLSDRHGADVLIKRLIGSKVYDKYHLLTFMFVMLIIN